MIATMTTTTEMVGIDDNYKGYGPFSSRRSLYITLQFSVRYGLFVVSRVPTLLDISFLEPI